MVRQIELACGFARGSDDAAARLTKLLELLRASGQADAPEVVSVVADLLSIPTDGPYPAPETSAVLRKARTVDALVAMLLGLAASQPVLLIVEDAHWIDPSTQELLGRAIDRLHDARVMMIVTHRPERATLGQPDPNKQIRVEPASARNMPAVDRTRVRGPGVA